MQGWKSKARYWLRQRANMGSKALRRTHGVSKKLGKPSNVTKDIYKMLVDPARNPVRTKPYTAQIALQHLPVGERQIQRKLKEHTRNGRKYKMAFVLKPVSGANRSESVGAYGLEPRACFYSGKFSSTGWFGNPEGSAIQGPDPAVLGLRYKPWFSYTGLME